MIKALAEMFEINERDTIKTTFVKGLGEGLVNATLVMGALTVTEKLITKYQKK